MHDGVECIKIEIPPPDGQEDAIVITTCDTELTMFYHVHHVHFDMFKEDDEQSEFDRFFDCIESYERENLVEVSVFDGDRLCGSWEAPADDPIEPTPNRRVIVRSWKGTYSRTIE